jgi:hypothetical protein
MILLAYKNLRANTPNASHVGLGVTALNLEKSLGSDNAKALAVVDGYDLWNRIFSQPDTTHVVMLAPYMHTAFTESLVKRFPKVMFALTCHSNVGFLQADRCAVKWLREGLELSQRVLNFQVAGNCQKLCEWLYGAYGINCLWLPNLYYLEPNYQLRKREMYASATLRLGIFGATRVQKNVMSAAAAALMMARQVKAAKTEIWISSGRIEGGAGVVASIHEMLHSIPGVELVEAGWYDWPDFRKLVRKMHLLLQPSYTESFNMVTADGIAEGVPSVVSPAIDWAPKYWQACPDTVGDIARVGVKLLFYSRASKDGLRALQKHNEKGLEAWSKWLSASLNSAATAYAAPDSNMRKQGPDPPKPAATPLPQTTNIRRYPVGEPYRRLMAALRGRRECPLSILGSPPD